MGWGCLGPATLAGGVKPGVSLLSTAAKHGSVCSRRAFQHEFLAALKVPSHRVQHAHA